MAHDLLCLASMWGSLPWSWHHGHALRMLRQHAESAGVLAEVFAAQALVASCGEGLGLGYDALDELMRRHVATRRLTIVERPARGAVGWFAVMDRETRHEVWFGRSSPLEASCGCHDYLASSLGACAHVLVVLADGWPRSRRGTVAARPTLCWDPIRPVIGRAPALERMWWRGGLLGDHGEQAIEARRWFRGDDDSFVVADDRTVHARQIAILSALARAPRMAEPAVTALLARERARLASGCPELDVERYLGELAVPLFPYQREGVTKFLASGRMVLADDMGLGKTAQAIASCHALLAAGRIDRLLIVVPAPLKQQWANEWRRFSSCKIEVVDGSPGQRRAQYTRMRGALIINYELVRRDLAELRRFDPELVVLDEAQRIKNRGTKTARSIKELAPARRLVLTGTPLENRLDELASIVEWVDDLAFEPRWRLDSVHTVHGGEGDGVIGAQHLDTVRDRIAHCFVRRRRREVLDQLPPRCDTVIPVPLTPMQHGAHEVRAGRIAVLMRYASNRGLTARERQQLLGMLTEQRIICNGLAQHDFEATWPTLVNLAGSAIVQPTPVVLASLASPKLFELRELVEAITIVQRRKVVVFSQWRRMLRLASWATGDILTGAGLDGTWFTGEESTHVRARNIAAFHDDPVVAVLWATDAGGVGLNLQHAASCVVNLDLPWNPAVLEQRIGRVHRLGQTRSIDVYNLVAVGGIEERIADIVDDKRMLFDGLLDSDEAEVAFERPARVQFERSGPGPQGELDLRMETGADLAPIRIAPWSAPNVGVGEPAALRVPRKLPAISGRGGRRFVGLSPTIKLAEGDERLG